MGGFFAFLFVAALVGVFKPYLRKFRRKHFAAAAAVFFVLAGVTLPPRGDQQAARSENGPASSNGAVPVAPSETKSGQTAAPASKWRYSEDRDEMRDSTTRNASIESENSVDLDFPYGTVNGTIWVRQRREDGLTVAFSVEKGQVLCSSFTNTAISIRFDDKPIQRFRCVDSSDGSTETAFITDDRRALAGLRTARRTIIEAEFFQQGRRQFTFDTVGFRWD